MPTTPNMNLILPVPTETPGPTYATQQNTAMDVIDAHDHTAGNGVLIPTAGIGVDADFPFNSFDATDVRSVRFDDHDSALGESTDLGCTYVAGGNLFFNDSSGTQIQLTAGGALNAASIGGIGGDYSTSTASVFYQSIDETFYFTSDTNTPADMNAGSVSVREPAVSTNAIKIKSATSLASSYDLTLPATVPASTKVLSMSSTGVLATGVASAVVTDDLAAQAVTAAKIANNTITSAQIANATLTTTQLSATAGILGTQIATDAQLQGLRVLAGGVPVIVGITNTTVGYTIITGRVISGVVNGGTGFAMSGSSVVYDQNFASAPMVILTPVGAPSDTSQVYVSSSTVSGFTPKRSSDDANIDNYSFIAIGLRAV